ncbi:MAG: hypothetical protein OXP28_00155 [Gammaproteobacteria bacterium]|nr:hypothetical protein [Gammaproteobacteria bacterium]
MSLVIGRESFALPVVRETAQLSIGIESLRSSSATIAATARRRARLMQSVFEDDDLFAWFEPAGDGSLYCAFATEPGHLLGENVRNWLREEVHARDFVYCERMGNQRAVVLVIDGHVIKDALVSGYELNVELRHALTRLDAVAPGVYTVFFHGIEVQDLELPDRSRAVPLEDSVLDWMEDAPGPLPELNPTNRAIRTIDVVAKRLRQLRIVRTVGLSVGSLVVAAAGVYWWQNRVPPPPPEDAPPPPLPIEQLNAEYSELLGTPDPGELIPAMHRAYRLFLSDTLFGELLSVRKLQWTRTGGGRLTIETSLPPEVLGGPRSGPRDALLDQMRRRAGANGWGVVFSGLDATFSLPVDASNRVEELRLPQPWAEGNPWHGKQLGGDLEALGTVTVSPGPLNQVYRGFSTLLELQGVEWSTGGTAAWLGNRLAGGPLVLESVEFEAGRGAAMDGRILFTTLWCVTENASTRRCLHERV